MLINENFITNFLVGFLGVLLLTHNANGISNVYDILRWRDPFLNSGNYQKPRLSCLCLKRDG